MGKFRNLHRMKKFQYFMMQMPYMMQVCCTICINKKSILSKNDGRLACSLTKLHRLRASLTHKLCLHSVRQSLIRFGHSVAIFSLWSISLPLLKSNLRPSSEKCPPDIFLFSGLRRSPVRVTAYHQTKNLPEGRFCLVGAVGLASPLRRLSAKADRHTPVCRRLLVKPTSRRFETSYITNKHKRQEQILPFMFLVGAVGLEPTTRPL